MFIHITTDAAVAKQFPAVLTRLLGYGERARAMQNITKVVTPRVVSGATWGVNHGGTEQGKVRRHALQHLRE